MRRPTYLNMADLGCPCQNKMSGMGAVTCGGDCGERLWDDPDRPERVKKPTIGQPVTPAVNTSPGTDQGPENNDWAVDATADSVDLASGMGDIVSTITDNWPWLLGLTVVGYCVGKKYLK